MGTQDTPRGYKGGEAMADNEMCCGDTLGEGCAGECMHCRHKATPRDEQLKRSMLNRLSRIIGQLGGVKKMIEDDRYCGDVLTQIAAAESALQALGYEVLRDHMATCVAEQIRLGNGEIVDEALELIKKLK